MNTPRNLLITSAVLVPGAVAAVKVITGLIIAKKTADLINYGVDVVDAVQDIGINLDGARASQTVAKSNSTKIIDRVNTCRIKVANLETGEEIAAGECEAVFNSKVLTKDSQVQDWVAKAYAKAHKVKDEAEVQGTLGFIFTSNNKPQPQSKQRFNDKSSNNPPPSYDEYADLSGA